MFGEYSPRILKLSEYENAIFLCNDVFRSAYGRPRDMEDSFRHVLNYDNINRMVGIFHGKQLVSFMTYLPLTYNIRGRKYIFMGISCVCTHPNFRKRGYAGNCLEYSLQIAREEGCDASILLPGAGAEEFYKKRGYWITGAKLELNLIYSDEGSTISSCEVIPVSLLPNIPPGIDKDREIAESIRTKELIVSLSSISRFSKYELRSQGRLAYIVLWKTSEEIDMDQLNKIDVGEYGGDAQVLEQYFISMARKNKSVILSGPNNGFLKILVGKYPKSKLEIKSPYMMRILNPNAFVKNGYEEGKKKEQEFYNNFPLFIWGVETF
ncbi:MAG: GNAT family N-acetyltransferase [bacterium]